MNRAMLRRMVMRAGAARLPPATALMAVAGSLAEASAAVAAGADVIDLGAATAETIIAFRSRHPGVPICAAGRPADVVRDAAAARVTGAILLCGDAAAALDSGIPLDQVLVDVLPAAVPDVIQGGLDALVDLDRAAGLAERYNEAERDLADRNPADWDLADRDAAAWNRADLDTADRDAGDRDAGDRDAGDRDAAERDLAAREPTGDSHTDRKSAGSGLTPVAGIVALAALSSWLGARAVRTRYPAQVRHALDMTASVRGIRRPTRTVRGLA